MGSADEMMLGRETHSGDKLIGDLNDAVQEQWRHLLMQDSSAGVHAGIDDDPEYWVGGVM